MIFLTALFAVLFAAIHVFIARLRFLDVVPRSRSLSAAGGVAVAYVFLHILPELSAHEETVAAALGVGGLAAEMRVYLVALAGLVAFYGLERAAKLSRHRSRIATGRDAVEPALYRVHIGAFALYNLLIGYLLLHREEAGAWSLIAYFLAMALHFVTGDYGLREHHRERYDGAGRWLLAAAVISGWLLGIATTVPPVAIAFLFAFLAGAVVLNVLKEELPEERRSRLWPFVAGAAAFAALLIAA